MRGDTMKGIKDQSQYNVVVLGDIKAGKTTLVSQCIFNKWKTNYKPTIEDCYRTLARLPDGKYKTVNVVDTAGSMEFPAMRELRIRSATAIIIVYNVAESNSIMMASALKKQVQQMREYDGVPISVIGNIQRGSSGNTLNYQIPAGIMEDSSCEHFFIDLSNGDQCRRLFDSVIEKCYETNTWKVEVWAMVPKNTEDNTVHKKKGLFSYLSFRKKKPASQIKTTRSLP